jgi:Putative adhesin
LTKKLLVVSAVVGLLFSLAGSTPAHDDNKATQPGQKIERSLPVDAQATVTLCVASGALKVRGWDKSEIRVRSLGAEQVEFRRIDRTKDTSKPATRVDVMVLNKAGISNPRLDCQAFADVDMEVPVGATVQVQTRDGDIMIAGVSGAYAGSQSGDITIERVRKFVEAGSVAGSISLKDSSGRINLSSAGGPIEVVNVRPVNAEDTFEVGTVSGDIQLDRVSIPKVIAKTVNGTVTMTGPLAKSGWYGFTNITGDIELGLPPDASFQLQAKVPEKHDIVSDFKLTYINDAPPPPTPRTPTPAPTPKPGEKKPSARSGPVNQPIIIARQSQPSFTLKRINAICGTGDATISVNSFGGTVRLKKI